MFVNRTLEYRKFLRKRDIDFVPILTTGIRSSLNGLRESIEKLTVKQERNCLPSFTSKKKKQVEIEKLKKELNAEMLTVEKNIEEVLSYPLPKKVTAIMYEYFFKQLKIIIYSYRSLQQGYLKKIDFYDDLEQHEEENGNNSVMLLENVKEVRKSIYDLTTVLLDMKMAVGQQALQIDRLDFYFDSINFYLEGTNAELEKMPNSYRGVKDKMMYFLLCLSILLVMVAMLKMVKNRA